MDKPDYGSFTEYFIAEGQSIYFAIFPEMAPCRKGIKPTERYVVYCIDLAHGSDYFIVEQDENYHWISERTPSFIQPAIINWVGERIDFRGKYNP